MKIRKINTLTLTFLSIILLCCNARKSNSDVIEVSRFQFSDSTIPVLKSGFYLISNVDSMNLVSKKLYDISKQKAIKEEEFFNLSPNNVLSFANVDSIYLEKSNSVYKGLFDIVLKLNQKGQKQLWDLTAKTKTLTEAEKYDGLIIGTIINNTLIQISHIHQQIDTNVISISGSFYKETVNDIKKYLEKGKNEN